MGYPVKVTYKKSSKKNAKKYTKNYSCKVSVKEPSIAVKGADVVAIGTTEKLTATVKPSTAKATFKSSDDTIATVDANGTVTGVKAGDVTITATAEVGTKTVTAEQKITVKKAIVKSAAQTEFNKIEAVIVGDTKELKAGDFKITNTATNGTVAVKSVSAKKNVADTFVIETFVGMTDAKEYSVEYAGTKATFTATDGTVAKVGVSKTEIPAGEKTEIKLTTLDANGVVLAYKGLDNTSTSKGEISADVKFAKGYQDGTYLFLPSVGDTATVKVTYHAGTFGTDGKETGNIEDTFTITAVDPALINLTYAVTIDANTASTTATWKAASFKINTNVKYGDDANAFFRITKDDGSDIGNYGDYKVESADKTKLLVEEKALSYAGPTYGGTDPIKVTGVSEGTTSILITKDGKTVASLPVTVLGKPVATTLDLSRASVNVVAGKGQSENVSLTLKDQYQEEMNPIKTVEINVLGKPKKDLSDTTIKSAITKSGDNKTLTINESSLPTENGTYTFKITAKDKNDKAVDRTLVVNRVKADGTKSYEVKIDKTEVDTTVGTTAYVTADKQITINVAEMVNGGVFGVYSKSGSNSNVEYTVKNASGDLIARVGVGADVKTCSAIDTNITGDTLTVSPVTVNGDTYEKNLSAGTYYVDAKLTVDSKEIKVGGSFTIKDTQDTKVSFNILNNKFEKAGTKQSIKAAFEGTVTDDNNDKFVKIYYDGIEQTNLTVTDIKGRALTSGGAYVKTVKVYVTVTNTTFKVPVILTVNDQIASCSDTHLND